MKGRFLEGILLLVAVLEEGVEGVELLDFRGRGGGTGGGGGGTGGGGGKGRMRGRARQMASSVLLVRGLERIGGFVVMSKKELFCRLKTKEE